jgi:hypothetical protein
VVKGLWDGVLTSLIGLLGPGSMKLNENGFSIGLGMGTPLNQNLDAATTAM